MKGYKITTDDALREQVRSDFPECGVVFDESLTLPAAYLDQIKHGTKLTTIKFKANTLRVPRTSLPVVAKASETPVGTVSYEKLVVKSVGELDEADARNDGSATLVDLHNVLLEAYGELSPESLLTIHYFGKFEVRNEV